MNERRPRVLFVSPSFPSPESGAEQMDRADGIRLLIALGCDVWVLAKIPAHADSTAALLSAQQMGVAGVTLVPYRYSNTQVPFGRKVYALLRRLFDPRFIDGAAFEFTDPVMRSSMQDILEKFQPDVVWAEYTFLWPLYSLARRRGIPVITRSVNFEPEHFLQENENSNWWTRVRYLAKLQSERITIRMSAAIGAITPDEAATYRTLGAQNVVVLPLRSLPRLLDDKPILPRPVVAPLHVCFLGSTYSVAHNRAAAKMVITEIAPLAEKVYPGEFVFHVFGGKLPNNLAQLCDGSLVVHEGYVPDLLARLREMDIAMIPSLFGCGQQQKVFEPIVRGLPTVTSLRAIAGYTFMPGVEFIPAETVEEYVAGLATLRTFEKRKEIGEQARRKGEELFSRAPLESSIQAAFQLANILLP